MWFLKSFSCWLPPLVIVPPLEPYDWLCQPPDQDSDDRVCELSWFHSCPCSPPLYVAVITSPFARVCPGGEREGVGEGHNHLSLETSWIPMSPRTVFCTSLGWREGTQGALHQLCDSLFSMLLLKKKTSEGKQVLGDRSSISILIQMGGHEVPDVICPQWDISGHSFQCSFHSAMPLPW